jgi:hypothetical protein
MLNELHELSVTLSSNNIKQQEWHDDYTQLPGGDCYRVWLHSDGAVAKIEVMSKDLVAVCRKYGNNQQAFPAFNIAPLYRITSDEDRAYYDAINRGKYQVDVKRLREMCVNDNWNGKLLKKVNGCLHKKIPNMPDGSAISSLMRITEQIDSTWFRTTLEKSVWEYIQSDTRTYLPILIHIGNAKKQAKDDTGSLSVILDLVDWEQFGYSIASENTTKQINEWLRSCANSDEQTESGVYDAFGTPYKDIGKPMPTVRLAPGFEVVLRSMFHEQLCQYRYRNADDRSYPIAKPNRSAAKASLEWISQPDNEKKTWRKIDNDAMLFVYPDKLPGIPLKYAELFGGNDNNKQSNTFSESRFEDIAEKFIITLNAIKPHDKPENIQIFALQQIPPALSKRAKVVFTRNLTVDGLIKAASEWQSGCHNIPCITHIELTVPFPLDVSKTANKVWKQNGTQADGKNAVKLMRYYQGMELLIDTPIPSKLLRIIHGVTVNSLGLILFIGNNLPQKKNPVKDTLKAEIGSLFPLLGLLLYKCNITKEDYMQDTAYLIGQVLKVSDALHTLYCEVKRNGDIPPQLAGNSVFVTASETPAKALALLSTRMNPYISWAQQFKTQNQEKSGLAAYFMRQYETLMQQLHPKLTENIRFNDLEKAQLFIGYLAELSKPDNKKSTEKESIKDEQ